MRTKLLLIVLMVFILTGYSDQDALALAKEVVADSILSTAGSEEASQQGDMEEE